MLKMREYFISLFAVVMLSFFVAGCDAVGANVDQELRSLLDEKGVGSIDLGPEYPPELINLGQALFFDKELSGNRDLSCATCHHPYLGTSDGLAVSIGSGGKGLGPARILGDDREFIARNSPDLFNRNAPEWTTMFWDGRLSGNVDDGFINPAGDRLPAGLDSILAAQAMFPVTSHDEMAGADGDIDIFGQPNELAEIDETDLTGKWDALMIRLLAIPEYIKLFEKAYPNVEAGDLGFQHAANAIGAYEASAFSFDDSPWDDYLNGDDEALSIFEKKGAMLFYGDAGCSNCHSGNLLTDQQYHNLATPLVGPGKGDEAPADYGRGKVTALTTEKYCFRTPPLRNVALTGPYMHNGSYSTLEAVIRHHLNPRLGLYYYDRNQLELELRDTVVMDGTIYGQVLATLDSEIQEPQELSDEEIGFLIAFLHSMTSLSAMRLANTIPDEVPSGLPVGEIGLFPKQDS